MLPPNHSLRPLEAVGTSGAYKCRGSGAPTPNPHPNHPLCHAVWAAANVFDVVAKFCTVATNLLKFCMAGIENWVAFVVGVLGMGCAAGEGRICTGSGLFFAWAVDFWGSSISSFPLPSSVIKAMTCSSFFQG